MELIHCKDYEYKVYVGSIMYDGEYTINWDGENISVEILNIYQCSDETDTDLLYAVNTDNLQKMSELIEENVSSIEWLADKKDTLADYHYDNWKDDSHE